MAPDGHRPLLGEARDVRPLVVVVMHCLPRCVAVSLGALIAVFPTAGAADVSDPQKVQWSADWPRARWWEVLDVVALTIASDEINEKWPTPTSASWKGGNFFDDWARSVFKGHSASLENAASTLGDNLYKGSVLVPYVVDNFFVALSIHRNADVALQMTLIDMQSLGFAGVVTLAAERLVPRERPFVADCGAGGYVRDASGAVSEQCGNGDDYKSFYSGHAAASATMAGLVCIHHQHIPLYGGGAADVAPCIFMIGVSALTGMTRLVADCHWASDVILGWGVGAFSGYVLPAVLHYGFGRGRAVGQMHVGSLTMMPVPETYPGGAGLGLRGMF